MTSAKEIQVENVGANVILWFDSVFLSLALIYKKYLRACTLTLLFNVAYSKQVFFLVTKTWAAAA